MESVFLNVVVCPGKGVAITKASRGTWRLRVKLGYVMPVAVLFTWNFPRRSVAPFRVHERTK